MFSALKFKCTIAISMALCATILKFQAFVYEILFSPLCNINFLFIVKIPLVCTVAILCLLSLCINNVTMILYCYLSHDTNNVSTSVVESFERVASTYAQQISLNETQNFTTASLTLVTELVSKNLTKHNQDYYISNYYVTHLICRII